MNRETRTLLWLLVILSFAWACTSPGQPPTPLPSALPALPTAVKQTGQSDVTPTVGHDIAMTTDEIITYPEEFMAFQRYLDVIGGRPGIADTGVIEATVASLTLGEACPYEEEACRIEPYPNDWGTVRVDRIVSYTPYAEQLMGSGTEQSSQAEPSAGRTTPGYQGPERQSIGKQYEELEERQVVQVQFLLTARPAKIRYAAMVASEVGKQTEPPAAGDTQQTDEHRVVPGEPVFRPIPKEGDYFVFTTGIGEGLDTAKATFPGLVVGSRFRAEVRYDGRLYIREYEPIP